MSTPIAQLSDQGDAAEHTLTSVQTNSIIVRVIRGDAERAGAFQCNSPLSVDLNSCAFSGSSSSHLDVSISQSEQ